MEHPPRCTALALYVERTAAPHRRPRRLTIPVTADTTTAPTITRGGATLSLVARAQRVGMDAKIVPQYEADLLETYIEACRLKMALREPMPRLHPQRRRSDGGGAAA